jgi:hypothetical protein
MGLTLTKIGLERTPRASDPRGAAVRLDYLEGPDLLRLPPDRVPGPEKPSHVITARDWVAHGEAGSRLFRCSPLVQVLSPAALPRHRLLAGLVRA